MSEPRPRAPGRVDSRRTVRALQAGTFVSVAAFAAAFALRLVSFESLANSVGALAMVALLLTPPAALATTALELRAARRPHAALAVLVLVILTAAAALALLSAR
jgi:amino acid permease